MNRDYGREIDELRIQLDELKQILQNKAAPECDAGGEGEIRHLSRHHIKSDEPDELITTMRRQTDYANEHNLLGAVAYTGVYSSGGRQSNWIRNTVGVDSLLGLIEGGMAEKVLQCIGNNDRLTLLLRLMKQPMSVAELLSAYGYSSTGQIYNLLKPLLSADILSEEKSAYAVHPHRIQGIIMLLAGIADLLDARYTFGTWDEQGKES